MAGEYRINNSQQPGQLVVYGAGGHGLVVADAAVAAGWQVLGFLDDDPAAQSSAPEIGDKLSPDIFDDAEVSAIVAIGDLLTRQAIQHRLAKQGVNLATVIHPTAWVSPLATLGRGVFIGANATVQAKSNLGDGVIINTGAIVEHHCQVDEYVHLAPGAVLCGGVTVGEGSFIGANATVRPQIHVGREVTVGINAAVVANVWDGVTVVGVPGRGS